MLFAGTENYSPSHINRRVVKSEWSIRVAQLNMTKIISRKFASGYIGCCHIL